MERVAKKAAPPFLTEQLLPVMDALRRPQKGATRASQPQYTTLAPDCQGQFTISGLSTTPKTAHRGPEPGQGGPPERGGKRPHHSSGGRSHSERASRSREAPSGGRRAGGEAGENLRRPKAAEKTGSTEHEGPPRPAGATAPPDGAAPKHEHPAPPTSRAAGQSKRSGD